MNYLTVHNFLKENNLTHDQMERIVKLVSKVNSVLPRALGQKHWSVLPTRLLNDVVRIYKEEVIKHTKIDFKEED